jgi:hypothetical protein
VIKSLKTGKRRDASAHVYVSNFIGKVETPTLHDTSTHISRFPKNGPCCGPHCFYELIDHWNAADESDQALLLAYAYTLSRETDPQPTRTQM